MAQDNSSQICFNWRDGGDCKFGSSCRFMHDGQETRGSQRKATQICYTFRDTGSCEYGNECRFSHDPTLKVDAPAEKKDAAKKPRAPRQKPAGGAGSAPVTSGDRLECFQFKESGDCSFGQNCRFLHAGGMETRGNRRKTAEVCFSLRDTGVCKFEDGCRYSHDLNAAPAGGAAAPKAVQVCWRFRDNGECEFGEGCRFSHEEEA